MKSDSYIDVLELRELRKNGKYKEVYEILEKVHSNYPELLFVTSQFLTALIDYKPNELDIIKELAEELLETKYSKIANYGLWFYYISINDLEKAARYYNLFKEDHYLLKEYNNKLRNFSCSVEFRKKVFDLAFALHSLESLEVGSKKYNFLTVDIGNYYFDNDDIENAIKYYNMSLESREDKSKGICYDKLGKCYFKIFKFDKAKDYFEKALDNAKTQNDMVNYYKYMYDYVSVLIMIDNIKEAMDNIKILEQGTNKDKNIAELLKAKIYRKTNQEEEALKILTNLLTKSAMDRKAALIELIYVYYDKMDQEKMKYYLDKYNSEFGHHYILNFTYYFAFNLYDEAIKYAKSLEGTEHEDLGKSYMGKAYNELGMYKKAEESLESITNEKNKIPALYELAIAKEKNNKTDEAIYYYSRYINYKLKIRDNECFNAGLSRLILLFCGKYLYDEALNYIKVYENINPEKVDELNFLYAFYYYRKQDYENAKACYIKMLGTSYDEPARVYLSVIYRYTGETEKIDSILDVFKGTQRDDTIILNKAKVLKDAHTTSSLMSALYSLEGIKNTRHKSMVLSEQIPILIRLKMYDKAEKYLEEANENCTFIPDEYRMYKSYIMLKKGLLDYSDIDQNNIFTCFSVQYDIENALSSIIVMNQCNQKQRPIYMSDDELSNFYVEMLHDIRNYDYYIDDLYDAYIIDMGREIGNYFGVPTSLLEIKCEAGTGKVHIIQPTLKRINVNKYHDFTRKRIDLETI